jgi:PPOX class probable F420-dependent enzyme
VDIQSAGPDVARFLDAARYAVVATHDPDGAIWQAVVWYAVTVDGIVMNARDGRRWLGNLRRDARLSFVVEDGEDYVILRGDVEVTDDQARSLAEARALARRYGSTDTFEGQRRVGLLFHPDHVAVHGELKLTMPEP